MKKISTLLLATVLTFAACHNDSSSTVGIYENDEPKVEKETTSAHEGNMNSDDHKMDTAKSTMTGTDATTKMSHENNLKDSTTH